MHKNDWNEKIVYFAARLKSASDKGNKNQLEVLEELLPLIVEEKDRLKVVVDNIPPPFWACPK